LSWNLVVAAVGIFIGLRFRAGALMAATLVTAALGLTFQARGHDFGWLSLWVTLRLVILLQLGYLAGLAAAALWRHVREG
jgi:hypothetical protein